MKSNKKTKGKYTKVGALINDVLIDNFGDAWVVLDGEISVGDSAYSHDTGDVYYVHDEDDLDHFNNIASKVEELKENEDG